MNALVREKIDAALLGIKSGAQGLRVIAYQIDEADQPGPAKSPAELRLLAREVHTAGVRAVLSVLATVGHAAVLDALVEVDNGHE